MSDGFELQFTLNRKEGLYGESVFFQATVTHTYRRRVSVASLSPTNRALRLILKKKRGEERIADQLSSSSRDGIYIQAPRTPEVASLAPGEKLELADDLLKWFGDIPAGTYEVWAEYRSIPTVARSEPVDLKILPAAIVAAGTPRWGLQAKEAPYTAAWAHGREDDTTLFYQQQSPYLPRNPWHCIRAAVVEDEVSAHAACIAGPTQATGHLYWFTTKGRLFFVPIDLENWKPLPPVEVTGLPFKGSPIASGLSLQDGSFLVPFVDNKRENCAWLHIEPSGAAKSYELDLGKNAPLGPFVSFFERDVRLHFIWSKPKGRQIDYAFLPLDDISSGFATRTIQLSQDPVLWFDAYLDTTIPVHVLRSMYLGETGVTGGTSEPAEPPPPKLMVWSVVGKGEGIVCTPISATDGAAENPVSFSAAGGSDLTVVSSAVTSEYGLSLLLADDKGKLFYASTMRKTMRPLEEIVDAAVTQRDCPSLMRGSDFPWVHLRFISDGKLINYVRLEPEDEPDPVESETTPWELEPEEEVPEDGEFDEEGDEK